MKVYLFDFNGVLVDDERVHFATFRDVVSSYGIVLDQRTYLDRYLAFDDAMAFRVSLSEAGLCNDARIVAECVAAKRALYMRAVSDGLVLFDGAFELLRACARRGDVAIVSGALRAEIDHILARAEAVGAVRTIVAAEDVTACKPDPAGYAEALRRLHAAPSEAIVIEDSAGGIQAAKRAGAAAVGVGHSLSVEALWAAGADLVVPRIADLDVDTLDRTRELVAPNCP